jgi:predicted HicB family RNase H-like nuclease
VFIIDNQFAGANISRTIRFTEKIFEELNNAAEMNDISFNLLVLQCCRYALDNMTAADGQT